MIYRIAALAMICTLASATPASAADPCKKVRVKDDKFGAGKTAVGVIQGLGQLRMIGLMMQHVGEETTLTVTVKEGGALNGGVPAGASVLARFSDDQVIELQTSADVSLQSYVAGSAVMTNVPYTFVLTPEQLSIFADKDLLGLRVPIVSQGTTFDWDANGGVQKTTKSVAACLQSL